MSIAINIDNYQPSSIDFGILDPQSQPNIANNFNEYSDTQLSMVYENPFHNTESKYIVNSLNKLNPLFNKLEDTIVGISHPAVIEKTMPQQINELDIEIEPIKDDVPYDFCNVCKIQFGILEDVMICSICGLEKDLIAEYNPDTYNISIDCNYNSRTTASTSFTFAGKKSYGYQKAILKSCSDYANTSHYLVKKEILNRINMYDGNKPPMNVQLNCIDLYCSIKENDRSYLNIINQGVSEQNEKKRLVFRSNGKWGIISACLYYACIEEGLTRTPREISDIIGIDEKYQSAGDKKLQEFYELGIINIPINTKLLNDYINRYFPLLDIPDKYKLFVTDIIARAELKGLHICNETRTSTKCVGVINLLCSRVPELKHITRDHISRECQLSKTTFIKYSMTLLHNWPLLKKVFKKHGVSMPKEWSYK